MDFRRPPGFLLTERGIASQQGDRKNEHQNEQTRQTEFNHGSAKHAYAVVRPYNVFTNTGHFQADYEEFVESRQSGRQREKVR